MTRVFTPEQKAKKVEQNNAWRKRNIEKVRAYGRKYYAVNVDKHREKSKQYHKLNAEKRRAAAAEWTRLNPERARRNARRAAWRNKGIDVAVAEKAMAAHTGTCDCCGASEPGGRRGWNLDHDHKTGAVRGILCHNCNTGIGKLGDTLESVKKAVQYLEKGAAR